jgi:hypothetical protein
MNLSSFKFVCAFRKTPISEYSLSINTEPVDVGRPRFRLYEGIIESSNSGIFFSTKIYIFKIYCPESAVITTDFSIIDTICFPAQSVEKVLEHQENS